MVLSRRVIDKAALQGGYVTRAQLCDLGLSKRAIDWRVKSGTFEVVTNGIYRLIPSAEHIDLIRGATLALRDAVASHQSAAHLLDLPRCPALVPTVTVVSHTTHRFPGVTVRRCDDLHRSHLTSVQGVRVTNVARTLFDLAGILEVRIFDELAEAAVLARRVDLRHLERIGQELSRRGKRGSRTMKLFLDRRAGHDPKATPLERKGRTVLVGGGLPLPIPQFPIPWAPRRRFDDAYPHVSLALEWDSRAWHEQRAAMESDRKRDRIAATHGWLVVRITHQDLAEHSDEVVATVSTLLESRANTNHA